MARVINTDSPGKRRGNLMRTVAELQRRLMKKTAPDEEARDMLALAVFCLREIAATVKETSDVWDERGYWKKAAAFETQWEWAGETAAIEVTKFTRKETLWQGCRRRLLK